jgi:sigma-B regulation protein RsbU (phosphoserine phosphatase)
VFDVQVDGDGAVWVIIADASSKGPLGALHAEMVRSAFRMAVHLNSDPSLVVARLNEIHFELPTRDIQAYFASAFVGRIAADKPELIYASAGHDIALLFEGRSHHHLAPTGPVLGVLPAAERSARTIPFGPASLLVLATDGITEARCALEPAFEFGTMGMVRAVLQSGSSAATADDVVRCADGFSQTRFRDDATVAVIKRRNRGRQHTQRF